MKKFAFCVSALALAAGSQLFAAPASANGATGQQPASGSAQQGQMMMQSPNCSQLTQTEQNFAAQIMDMNNRTMFCTQFTAQQRQQAMQMMGQPDSSGNTMNADQAVQQVMGSGSMPSPATQPRPRTSGGACPVK